ncbi:hypothetical protein C5708_08590 [Caulobacter sp. CCUG 60055]|nr:hypothetical protein [Caulobacter sp. CCUG 60055]
MRGALTRPPGGRWRCGVPDPPRNGGGLGPKAYGLKASGWRGKFDFSWSYSGSVVGVGGPAAVTPVLVRAFGLWAQAAPLLRFRQVASGGDIALEVGPLTAPAIGLTTPDGRSITFSNGAAFSANATGPNQSLLNVATHEIGHALGLLHATTGNAIMNAFAGPQEVLNSDDYGAIRALYNWPPQQQLAFGTEQAPALCVCGGVLVMAWRGAGHDRNIWMSFSRDGANWSPQKRFGDVATIGGPALAYDGTRLWMVWRGTGDDQGLYFKSSTDLFARDNPPQQGLGFAGSSHGPRIAIIAGVPTMVWKGVNDDQGIYASQFRAGRWQGQTRIPNVGTAAAPAICQDIDGGARLLWRGVRGDQSLYTTTAPPGSLAFAPQVQVSWAIPGNGGAGPKTERPGSAGGPSLAVMYAAPNFTSPGATVIFAAWRGVDGDQGLWFSQLARDVAGAAPVWSSQANVHNVGSSEPPGIAYFNNQIRLAWKGVENDNGVYTLGN